MTDDERKELEALGVTIYDEPLLTEDGFVNPVFEAKLGAEIEGAWADATARCEADPEWNTPRITYWREVAGYLALWAVRQVQHPDKTPFAGHGECHWLPLGLHKAPLRQPRLRQAVVVRHRTDAD